MECITILLIKNSGCLKYLYALMQDVTDFSSKPITSLQRAFHVMNEWMVE